MTESSKKFPADRASRAPQGAFHYAIPHIRLGEFDLGGVLYHARYFHLYEDAREAALASIGWPYPRIMEQQWHLAIVESHQSFVRPVFYGKPIELRLWTEAVRRSSVVFYYELFSTESDGFLHAAWTKNVLVSVGADSASVQPFPETLKKGLEQLAATVT
ncbi:MAG: acyl-CoA thioesterase [Bdellovibrionales bacterium]|nr:acyl-CoA thioesterase [Bdellovibrionales bacterium]